MPAGDRGFIWRFGESQLPAPPGEVTAAYGGSHVLAHLAQLHGDGVHVRSRTPDPPKFKPWVVGRGRRLSRFRSDRPAARNFWERWWRRDVRHALRRGRGSAV